MPFWISEKKSPRKREKGKESILLNWKNDHDSDLWVSSYKKFRDNIGIWNLSYGAAYTPYIIADTPTNFDYKDIKGRLHNSTSKPEELFLANLVPVAHNAVKYLDNAIEDYINFTSATGLAAQDNSTKPTNDGKYSSDVFLAKALLYEDFQDGSGGTQKTIKDAGKRLIALITWFKSPPEKGFILSEDLMRHLEGRLVNLIPKINELLTKEVVAGNESDVLGRFQSFIQKIDEGNVADFIKLIEKSLIDDI